jgi:hypothetical protein
MSRLSRFVLAVALVAGFSAPARAVDPDKLLPKDADTVIYFNMKQLIGSDIIKKYALEQLKQALDGQEAKKLLEDMGLDPLKDIETLWAGTSGKDQTDMKGLLIVHGKFDPEKLLKAAEAASKKDGDKFSIVKDGNTTLFKYQPEEGNPVYGTVVDDTTVVAASDKKLVAEALKQKDATKAPISADLAALVKKQDAKATMFATSLVKGKFKDVKIPQQLPIDLSGFEKALPNTDSIGIVLKVSGDVTLEITMGMKDEDAAEDMAAAMSKLVDGIKGFVPLITAADPRAKPLADVVKTIKTEVKKKDVITSGKITGDEIGKMIKGAD